MTDQAPGTSSPSPSPALDDLPIGAAADLLSIFEAAAKPRNAFRIGIEQEKITVRADGSPVPYEGNDGIGELFRRLEGRGFVAKREDGAIIELRRGEERITLEPGGQVELSAPALPTAVECRDELAAHVREVTEVGAALGIHFIAGGFRPFGRLDDVFIMPKRRYAVMREYLPRHGRLGLEMMKRTATVQANLDFENEAEAVAKLRTAYGVTSVVTALFAASPLTDGRPNGYKSFRAAVWLDTDESRCGVLPFVFEPGFGFERYATWALDVPMFFVVRQGVYQPVEEGFTFRRFLAEGFRGERATHGDWELHLSTLFPEVRLKKTIEVRGADAGPMSHAFALGALWRGLLDDAGARDEAWRLVASVTPEERQRARREVPRAGLAGTLGGRPMGRLALDLVRCARQGLARLGAPEDAALLDPLEDAASRGRCPADDLLEDFQRLGGDPAGLVTAWELGKEL